MHSRPSASTARFSASASAPAHGRSQSLSDPRAFLAGAPSRVLPSASSTSTFEFYDAPSISNWQHGGPHPSPDPNVDSNANANVNPHVALRAASPQSTVSSGSPKGDSPVAPSPSADASSPSSSRTTGKKSSIDRNRKPCGTCSEKKRKCKLIPGMPNLCERCKGQGRSECPPHISWSTRKANMADSGSLSPLEIDEGALSSRSGSPSYVGPGRSPVGYPAVFHAQTEHGAYSDMSTTHEWVQAQTQAPATPSSSNAIDLGAYEALYAPHAQHPIHLASPHLAQQGMQNDACPNLPVPVCHVCQTPYNVYLMLNYVLTQLQGNMPSPPYELDQSLLKMYGHVPPSDDHYKTSY